MRRLVTAVFLFGVVLTTTPVAAHAADPGFTLTADYTGLYPNAAVDVPVTVHNPQTFPIDVETASAAVGDAGPGCPASNVEVTAFAGTVRVPAGGTAVVPLHFHMLPTAPDSCQGATFPLTFRAAGNPASTPTTTTPAGGFAFTTGGFAFTGNGESLLLLAGTGAAAVIFGSAILAARRRREALR